MRLLLLLFLTLNLLSAQKLALLIGNSNYTHLNNLSSPSQDIPELAQKLRDMNFKVTELYDLDEKSMKRAIKSFKKRLLKNPNAIALFYYSGHGSQAYGESYLIPIDGDTRDEADVEADGVKVETIAQKMATARTKANILFLDACRDVPTGTMGGTKGLGQVKRQPSSTLILYSTSKNKTAKDDRIFNKTVLDKLALNMPFSSLANDISYAVGQKTSRQQVPELLSTGLPNIILSAGRVSPPPIGITTIDGVMYQNQPFSSEDIKHYDNDREGGRVWKWEGAVNYCKGLTLRGYSDWRLANTRELLSKSKQTNSKGYQYYVSKKFVENMPPLTGKWKNPSFWDSPERDSSSGWGVNFRTGTIFAYDKEAIMYVLCERITK